MKKILVLSSAETDYTLEANDLFVNEIQKLIGDDIHLTLKHYNDLLFDITSESMTLRLIDDQTELKEFDLVYFKSYYRYSEVAVAAAQYLQQANVTYICRELDKSISFTKLTQYARLSRAHLPIARTIYMSTGQIVKFGDATVSDTVQYPCVLKAVNGKGGSMNFLVRSGEELTEHALRNPETSFVIQQFIPNSYDLRVLVANGQVKLVIKRQRLDEKTHLNNTSQGALATLLDVGSLNASDQQLALEAAQLFERDIAGVDIMFASDTGKSYVLEVNASPQVATGAFRQEKLQVYADLFKELLHIDKQ